MPSTLEKQNDAFNRFFIGKTIRHLSSFDHDGEMTGQYSLFDTRDGKDMPASFLGCEAVDFSFLCDTENGRDKLCLTLGNLDARQGNWSSSKITIDEIHGDLRDLVDAPLLQAEAVGHYFLPHDYDRDKFPPEFCNLVDPERDDPTDAYEWVFYKFATIKGSVTIRFYGRASYCYSTTADMMVRAELYNEN